MPQTEQFKYFDPLNLKKLRNMDLIARFLVEGFISGLHRSPHHGFSVEFAEYRKYVLGDDVRRIDWKVWPKTRKLYVKEFHEETNLRCTILLDVSASMGYGTGGVTKLEYASYLTAALTYLMIKQNDSVGLILFNDGVSTFIPAKSTPSHLKNILVALEHVEPQRHTDVSRAFHAIAERLQRRGLIIVLSDFYDKPDHVMKALKHFRHKKHEVLAFHLFDHAELDFPFDGVVQFEDMETGDTVQLTPRHLRDEYQQKVRDFIRTYQRRCSDSDIDYLHIDTHTPYDLLLAQYLSKRRRLG